MDILSKEEKMVFRNIHKNMKNAILQFIEFNNEILSPRTKTKMIIMTDAKLIFDGSGKLLKIEQDLELI